MCLSGLEEFLLPVRNPAHILISLFFLYRGCHLKKKKKREGKNKVCACFFHTVLLQTPELLFFSGGEIWTGSDTTKGVSADAV